MNHWPFVIGAYGVSVVATMLLTVASYVAMRGAERAADNVRRK